MTGPAGCGTALVTPFTADGRVDEASLGALVEWQATEGIDFLVTCTPTGEGEALSAAEREGVVALVADAARGRVPIMAGIAGKDTREASDEARRVGALGVSWVLCGVPAGIRRSPEEFFRHFTAVADAAEAPVCLDNASGRAGISLNPATVLQLAQHPNIVGLNDAGGDLARVQHLLLGRPDGFAVLSGTDWLTLACCAVGGDGVVSVAANEIPRQMAALVRHGRLGQLDEARTILYQVLPLLEANFLEPDPGPVKAALAAMGKIQDILRTPLVTLSSERRPLLHAALREAGVALPEAGR
jgi:4-hydroxy-tetrahydrodipicolinate synthase